MYYIIACHKCGTVRYVKEGVKNYYCLRCRTYRPLKKAVLLGTCEDVKVCEYVIQRIKAVGEEPLESV